MSLLLDALQRASQEKEKTSQAARASEQQTADISLAPADEGPIASPAPETEPANAPPLEFSFTPEPPVAEVPPVLQAPPVESPVAATSAPARAPAPSPAAAPDTPMRGARPAEAAPLPPRVAREILGGSPSRPAPGKRLIMLAAIALILSMAGGIFLFLSNDLPQATSILPPPAAAEAPPPAGAPAMAPSPVPNAEAAPLAAAATPSASAPVPAATAQVETNATPATPPDAVRPAVPRTAAPKTAAPRLVARPATGNGLEGAYAALLDGRLDSAAEGYRRALADNGEERDALLGLGHIAHRQGRREEARAYYERVLRQEPENAVANAGMLALQAEGDPSTAASRAREMAERNPDSAAAFATLGGALVREGKLADAQQAFFRAAALEPANAAHAYNLAVALDRLHKPELAANYYAKALALGERSGAAPGFPRDIARQRLEQLRAVPSRN